MSDGAALGAGDPLSVRASDDDREVVAERLRVAHTEGRLTVGEFGERLDATYAARTHADLVPLTRDLPAMPAAQPRTGDEPLPARRTGGPPGRVMRAAWATWTTAVLINVVIWAAVSLSAQEWIYFWPMWVAGPWGAVLLAGTLFGRDRR